MRQFATFSAANIDNKVSMSKPMKLPGEEALMSRQAELDVASYHSSNVVGKSLLLVDDSVPFRERLARAFRERGYTVRTAGDYYEAISIARQDPPDLAVVDLRMPGPS